MNFNKHFKFKCPFCRRSIEPRKGARACVCGYWIKPVSEDECAQSTEQKTLLEISDSNYCCQESWEELINK